MEKMKAISWDKLRRLVGRKKSKDRDTDSSRFQRSYSFKRASVRKSGRRTGNNGPGIGAGAIPGISGSALAAAAAIAGSGSGESSLNSTSSQYGGRDGYCISPLPPNNNSDLTQYEKNKQIYKSNGQLSVDSACSGNSNDLGSRSNLKLGDSNNLNNFQGVTVNVDVIADGKNILKQEKVFGMKGGGKGLLKQNSTSSSSSSDLKVALVPNPNSNKDRLFGSSTSLCINNNPASKNDEDAVVQEIERCLSPSSRLSLLQSRPPPQYIRKENGNMQRKDKSRSPEDQLHKENYNYDEDDDMVMNKWIQLRSQGGGLMGRRQRTENIYRLMSEEEEETNELEAQSNSQETPVDQDGEVFEDEFYLAMLAESPRPLRRSTDSALSRLTSDSSHSNSRSRSRLDDNLDYGGGGLLGNGNNHQHVQQQQRPHSRLYFHSPSALDLVDESSSGENNRKSASPQAQQPQQHYLRRRQQSPTTAAISPTPPPHFQPRPPSSAAQQNPSNVQKKSRAKRDLQNIQHHHHHHNSHHLHKSQEDLLAIAASDKNSPDSGSYHHSHYGSSSKLSEEKHGSGSSISTSRDDLIADLGKEASPDHNRDPEHIHRHHHHHHHHPPNHIHNNHHHHHPNFSQNGISAVPHPYLQSSNSSIYRAATGASAIVEDPNGTPKSFWWTQKAGSTMTTSSGASKDSGFSLGRSWAMGLAHKVFGRRGHGQKGPILSVSKEGYFQRTNLRRASGKRIAYPIPLRNSITRRSSSRKQRKSGKAKARSNNAGNNNINGNNPANSAAVESTAASSSSSSFLSSAVGNSAKVSNNSKPIRASTPPDPVQITNIDDAIDDDEYEEECDQEETETKINKKSANHSRNNQENDNFDEDDDSNDEEEMENTKGRHQYNHSHQQNYRPLSSPPLLPPSHDPFNFDGDSVNIYYQTNVMLSRRQRMLQRQQQVQQSFLVYATPHSAEPLIFVPPEKRRNQNSTAVGVGNKNGGNNGKTGNQNPHQRKNSKKNQPVPYSKTVFEIRNHCLPMMIGGESETKEPVEMLRLPRLKCEGEKKSVLITKVSGPYDNDGRLSRASVGSGGIKSNSNDCLDRLPTSSSPLPANENYNGGMKVMMIGQNRRVSQHQIKSLENDLNGISDGRNESRQSCRNYRESLNHDSKDGDEDDEEEYDDYFDEDDDGNENENESNLSRINRNRIIVSRNGGRTSGGNRIVRLSINSEGGGAGSINSQSIRRKQSTRRNNINHHHHSHHQHNHHHHHHHTNGRPSKVIITKPSAVAVYRRYSTLYKRGKLGTNFALPRPTIHGKDGKKCKKEINSIHNSSIVTVNKIVQK